MSSMKKFIGEAFLLHNQSGRKLFFEIAEPLPIIDYHNHLDASKIAGDLPFKNLTELWVASDPYKHRAMRINGIPEAGITGNATDKEKFMNWAKTAPKTAGNPLYHWGALELKRFFDTDLLLNESTAEEIWRHCNQLLAQEGFTTNSFLKKCHVEILCTSDDILDDFEVHRAASKKSGIQVLPSLRADTIINIDRAGIADWLQLLSSKSDTDIRDLASYKKAISNRLDELGKVGCRLIDLALDSGFKFNLPSTQQASAAFEKLEDSQKLSLEQAAELKADLLMFLGNECANRNWTLQLHIGALRQTSTRLRKLAGAAGGYAAIGNPTDIGSIATYLDTLEQEELLPKVILYNLNPRDNEAIASLTGSFAEDGMAGKVQFGPAWWYNDHFTGIVNHLTTLADYSLLSNFIGMTTDSRSFLSLCRHEYFRRIFCNLLGKWVETGRVPNDQDLLNELVTAVCYGNAKKFFKVKTK